MTVTDVKGGLTLDSRNGTVAVSRVDGNVTVSKRNGIVTVIGVNGDLTVTGKVNGLVTYRDITGRVRVPK